MTSVALIVGLPHFAALPALSALGFCLGILLVAYGFRPGHKAQKARSSFGLKPLALERESTSQPRVREHIAEVQVIRLSPEPGPTTTSHMTQQQKIAAALARAGVSASANRANEEASERGDNRSNIQVMTAPAETARASADNGTRTATEQKSTAPSWRRPLIIACGGAMALLSLYLFLRSRGLF